MIPEAKELIAVLPKTLQGMFATCYAVLVDEGGCDAYVKTIYVGFSLDEEMVSAIYPHHDRLEIAMALPEDIEGSEFKDATHLTWPTMPVAIEARSADDTERVLGHLREALRRVAASEHDVRRPNEHFRGRRGTKT